MTFGEVLAQLPTITPTPTPTPVPTPMPTFGPCGDAGVCERLDALLLNAQGLNYVVQAALFVVGLLVVAACFKYLVAAR